MEYFQYKSLTWWTGVLAIIIGVMQAADVNHPSFGIIADVLNVLGGGVAGTNPAQLIVMGFGLIGLRAKLDRMAA